MTVLIAALFALLSYGPQAYLYDTYPSMAPTLDCVIEHESNWEPWASGAGGRYIGLAQFDYTTWMATPQGQAGLSRTDPYASVDALAWSWVYMPGGWHHWPNTGRICLFG